MPDIAIKVTGESLQDLQKALKRAEATIAKTLRAELKDAAGIVANAAKGKVPTVTGAAAGSIRAGSTLKGAYVKGGGAKVGYYGWLDFGSRSPIRGRPRSVGPWKASGKGPHKGRFIYPALDEKFDAVIAAVQTAVDKSIKEAGF